MRAEDVGDCRGESNGLLTRGVPNAILESKYDAQNECNDGHGVGNLSLLHGLEGLRELTSSKKLGNNCRALMEYLQIRWLFLCKYCQKCNSLRIAIL